MPVQSLDTIDTVRSASRDLVRLLGFMGGDFAGTDLPPSSVHAMIEIESGGVTARDLAARLHLEKSSVSRMLRKLVEIGDIVEQVGEDGRVKVLSLTSRGRKRLTTIHAFAREQVSDALGRLSPDQVRAVSVGLQHYAWALAGSGERPNADTHSVELLEGYRTGLIARIAQMHAQYYSRTSGFGQRFESVVAGGVAEFCDRLGSPRNAIWSASVADDILGSVAIDGDDATGKKAHLRWFIVDEGIRGTGAGSKLLTAALDFVDRQDFTETYLWTFSGLDAARHLYERHGFALVEERPGSQWGKEVLEQRFLRRRDQ